MLVVVLVETTGGTVTVTTLHLVEVEGAEDGTSKLVNTHIPPLDTKPTEPHRFRYHRCQIIKYICRKQLKYIETLM